MNTWRRMRETQPIASQILINSIENNRLSHAYLIQGTRGTGKRSFARLLAKTLYCTQREGVEPCHACNYCQRIKSGNFPDVYWIKPDGQSIKINQIENLQKEFTYASFETEQKVYVIEDAHTLTVNASNRILKFLEEPKQRTVAIILTENIQSIIPTIRSRCQILDLKPLKRPH